MPNGANLFVFALAVVTLGCGDDPVDPAPSEPAAYWVLAKGGAVTISGSDLKTRLVQSLEELPMGNFRVQEIDLTGVKALSSEEFQVLERLQWMQSLVLRESGANDDALKHLVGMPSLNRLDLSDTDITGAALPSIGRCTELTWLNLCGTQVADGLEGLKGCWKLAELDLSRCPLKDASLEPLADFKNLVKLDLSQTGVIDSAILELSAQLRYCKIIR